VDGASLLAAAGLLHAGLPWALHQVLGLGVARRVRGGRGTVVLTFDDGPDPKTTPKVLDVLAREGARATFFVLEPRAKEHPELVRELKAAGHEVALHGRVHRHAWLKSPLSLYPELRAAKESLEDLLGEPVRFYRPPHGGWTWPLLWASYRLGLLPVTWEVEAGDWREGTTPGAVAERVLARTLPGSVVVMHDAGPGGRVSGEALSLLLPELKARGFVPRTLGEAHPVVGDAGEVLPRLLTPVEFFYARLSGVEPVFTGAHSVFRLAPTRLFLELPGFPRGTPAAEIHLDSERMRRAGEGGSLAAYRAARASMADLARAAARLRFRDAALFFGVSLFWEVLTPLGFRSHPLPPGFARRVTPWLYLLHRAHGGRPLRRVEARLVYIPRGELLRRYGEPTPG